MSRLASQAQGGYYPTPESVVNLLTEIVTLPERPPKGTGIRWLDPCAGPGAALYDLSCLIDYGTVAQETYGIELHDDRAAAAGDYLNHILNCDFFDTAIANGAFSALFLNPPYDYDEENKRLEHKFLERASRYLAPHGLLIFVIPQEQLRATARLLASRFYRFACWSFPDPEFTAFRQVVLCAYRKAAANLDAAAQKDLEAWADCRPQPLGYAPVEYIPPAVDISAPLMFESRIFDRDHAITSARRYGLWNDDGVRSIMAAAEMPTPSPLMPPRLGHMALLTAAGFLNNVKLTDPDYGDILIKGSSHKSKTIQVLDDGSELHQDALVTNITTLSLADGALTVISSGPPADSDEAD